MAHADHDWDAMYTAAEPPPWDIGAVQPALAAYLAHASIADPVVDAGCGTGELTLLLASRERRVLGFDASEPAIATARGKAAERSLAVDFRVADAARVAELGIRPRTVLDSGLLHSLDEQAAAAYVGGLATICVPGALVCVLAMSIEAGQGWGQTEESLRTRFAAPTWVSSAVDGIQIHARWQGEDLHMPGFLLTTHRAK
ncbi:MAG TPA: class I SAM-dependent methyltransferase [Candidatus Ruania gallistercoris]|uniref:Class I SAM-dependent methyltransferase n=1 Tax=Candidatus Ruania gallistercoris TaxID=2838746 RepID=A0A9D2ED28_9MICO|nr:class I SAM-dependent methyltransferase [Candidatus Ruania gallistercoris]